MQTHVATRRHETRPVNSSEHRIVQLARRCNLVAQFDPDVRAQGGLYISIVDGSGRLQYQCTYASLAMRWLAMCRRTLKAKQ